MPGYTLKVKTKRGQQLLNGLGADSTVADLKMRLNELTEIPESNLHILTGDILSPLSEDNETVASHHRPLPLSYE